jgi:hypothetical protein
MIGPLIFLSFHPETGSKPVFFGVTKNEENDYEIADR